MTVTLKGLELSFIAEDEEPESSPLQNYLIGAKKVALVAKKDVMIENADRFVFKIQISNELQKNECAL